MLNKDGALENEAIQKMYVYFKVSIAAPIEIILARLLGSNLCLKLIAHFCKVSVNQSVSF